MKFGDAVENITRIARNATGIAGIGVLAVEFSATNPVFVHLIGSSIILHVFARYGWHWLCPWLAESVILLDQTPDYDRLRKQLKKKDQVIMAAFTINGQPFVAVAVHPDSGKYQALLLTGEAMRPEQIAQIADDHKVIFTLATPDE